MRYCAAKRRLTAKKRSFFYIVFPTYLKVRAFLFLKFFNDQNQHQILYNLHYTATLDSTNPVFVSIPLKWVSDDIVEYRWMMNIISIRSESASLACILIHVVMVILTQLHL